MVGGHGQRHQCAGRSLITKLLFSMEAPGLDGAYRDLDRDARDLGVISLSLGADARRLGCAVCDLDETALSLSVTVETLDDEIGFPDR